MRLGRNAEDETRFYNNTRGILGVIIDNIKKLRSHRKSSVKLNKLLKEFLKKLIFHLIIKPQFSYRQLLWMFCLTIKRQCCPHIETSKLICCANQLTGFYIRATLALNGLRQIKLHKKEN